MAVYSTGDNKYSIVQESTANTPVYTGDNLILATEREINIDVGLEQINKRKASGLSYQQVGDGQDMRKGNQTPVVTLPFDGHADNTALLFASFFQNVTESGAGPYVYQFDPYTTTNHRSIKSGDTTPGFYGFTLLKSNENSNSLGESLAGSVVRSITIGSTRGEPMSVSAEIVGMTYASTVDVSTGSFTEFGKKVIMHFDWDAATLATNAKDFESWSITMTNGAYNKFGINQTPQEHLLNNLEIDFECTFPWDSVDYKASAKNNLDFLFEIYKGSKTGASAEDFYLQCNFELVTAEQGETEGMKTWSLTGKGGSDGTNPAIQIITATATDRLS